MTKREKENKIVKIFFAAHLIDSNCPNSRNKMAGFWHYNYNKIIFVVGKSLVRPL